MESRFGEHVTAMDDKIMEVFGERDDNDDLDEVTITAPDGTETTARVGLGDERVDRDFDESGRSRVYRMEAFFRIVGTGQILPRSTLSIGGVTWEVDSITHQDGSMIFVELKRTTDTAKHAAEHVRRTT